MCAKKFSLSSLTEQLRDYRLLTKRRYRLTQLTVVAGGALVVDNTEIVLEIETPLV